MGKHSENRDGLLMCPYNESYLRVVIHRCTFAYYLLMAQPRHKTILPQQMENALIQHKKIGSIEEVCTLSVPENTRVSEVKSFLSVSLKASKLFTSEIISKFATLDLARQPKGGLGTIPVV